MYQSRIFKVIVLGFRTLVAYLMFLFDFYFDFNFDFNFNF